MNVSCSQKWFLHLITGQFAQEPKVKVYGVHEGADPKKKEATMEVKGNKLAVTRYCHIQISDFYCFYIRLIILSMAYPET